VPERRERLVVPLVVLSLAPLLVAGLVAVLGGPGRLSFALVVALLFVSGLGASWLIPLNVSFVQAVPNAYRGRAFGVAVSGLYGVQALGALAAGLGAEGVSASGVLALSGGLGLIAVAPALVAYRRTQGFVAPAHAGGGPSQA
jgi:MFS family permease